MNFKRAIKALDAEDADPTLASFLVNEASSYMASQGYAELVREHVPQAELDHTAVKKYLAACIAALTPAATCAENAQGDFLTVQQAAVAYQLGERTVYRLVEEGKIKGYRAGKAVRIRRLDLERHLAGRETLSS